MSALLSLEGRPEARAFLMRVLRFGVVGVSATLLYLGLAWGFHQAGMMLVAASLAAQLLSLVYSYVMQKAFTFGISGNNRRYGPRFVLATIALIASAQALVGLIEAAGAGAEAALLANAVYYPLGSFLLQFLWVFREAKD